MNHPPDNAMVKLLAVVAVACLAGVVGLVIYFALDIEIEKVVR